MRLIEFQAVNYGPHADRTVRFSSGLNALVGPNGSGKSTVVDGMLACLTGDFVGDGVKADHVRKGAGKKDRSFIRLVLEHAGTAAEVVRSLVPNSRSLTINGEKIGRTEGEVNDALTKFLNVGKDIISDYAFVRQWETAAVLSSLPSKRLAVLNRLFRIEQAERVYRLLTERTASSGTTADVSIARLADARRAVNEAEQRVTDLSLRINNLPTVEDSQRLIREYGEAAASYNARQYLQNCIHTAETAVTQKRAAVEARRVELELRRSELAATESIVASMTEEARQSQQTSEQWAVYGSKKSEYLTKLRAYEQAEGQLAAIGPEPLRPDDNAASQIKTGLSQANQTLQVIFSKMKDYEIARQGKCPTCGSPASDDMLAKYHAAQAEFTTLNSNIELLKAADADYEKKSKTWQNWQSARDHWSRQLGVRPVEPVPPAVPKETCEAVSRAYAQALANRSGAERLLQAAEREYTTATADLFSIESSLAANREELSRLTGGFEPPSQEDYQRAVANKAARESAESELKAAEKTVLSSRLMCEELQRLKDQADRQEAKKEHLGQLKAVFQPSGLTAKVVDRCMASVSSAVNAKLDQFGNPFSVRVGPQASFDVTFANGKTVPANRLSGGEKMILALAFRLSVMEAFGGELGFLCLDEPTVGLDSSNRTMFTRCLAEASRAARNGGTQLVIVTHDRQLAAVADTVVDLAG